MSNTYNLQLRHGAESQNFDTREKVIGYVDGILKYGSGHILPYEPILFFYGEDDSNKNAIILVGLPEGKTNDGKSYFLIDTAAIKEQIEGGNSEADKALEDIKEALSKETEERESADETLEAALDEERDTRGAADDLIKSALNDEISERKKADEEISEGVEMTKEDLASIIDACGLIYNTKLSEDRVSYEPDSHDEVIRDAESVADAIDKISKFVAKLGSSLKVNVEDTDTVKLTMDEDSKTSENTLTADVRIAGAEGLSRKNFDNNILGKTTDGIYAACSLEADPKKPNHLIFKTSGYLNGAFKADAFETEVELTSYKGNDGDKTGVKVIVDEDEISAELKIATDADNNILKMEDGEFYVEGLAKNIKYGDTTVAKALTSHKNRLDDIEDTIADVKSVEISGDVSDTTETTVEKSKKGDFTVSTDVKLSSDKSIIVADGGLKANINASYVEATSKLTIQVGNDKKEIDLSGLGISVLENASYDSVNERIILVFNVNGQSKQIDIPATNLIHDTDVEDTKSIDLTMKSVTGGPNVLSAELRVDSSQTDNMLTVNKNGAYVSKKKITDITDALSKDIDGVKDLVANEEKRATEAENNIKTTADSALEKASKNETNVESLQTKVGELDKSFGTLDQSVTDLSKQFIDNKTSTDDAIKNNHTLIEGLTDSLAKEVTSRTEADATLNGNIESVNNAVTTEVNRATTAEGVLQGNIDTLSKTISDNKADAENKIANAKSDVETLLKQETERAKAAEESNSEAISKINGDVTVDGSIKKALNDANTHTDNEISALKTTLEQKIADSTTSTEGDTDNKIEATKTELKQYTDEKISSAKEEVKGYTDAETESRKTADAELSTAINNEVSRAQKAEQSNADAIAIINGNEAQVGSIKKAKADAEKYADDKVAELKGTYEEDKKTFALKSDIPTVPTNVSAFTNDAGYLTEHQSLEEYAKKTEVESVYATKETVQTVKNDLTKSIDLKANKTDVEDALSKKLSIENAQFIYATKDAVQDVKDNYATKTDVEKADTELSNRIKSNETSINNFAIAYNSATSTLTFTTKDGTKESYQLYSGSLIKSGRFDTDSNSIILTIETAGVSSEVVIPVSSLLSDVESDIKENSVNIQKNKDEIAKLSKKWVAQNSKTIELTKSTIGDEDTLTASVILSSSNKQAIQATDGGLYVSNDVADYTCDFGSEGTISTQTAISKLLEKTNNTDKIDGLTGDITELTKQVNANTNSITSLTSSKLDVSIYNSDKSNFATKSDIPDMSKYLTTEQASKEYQEKGDYLTTTNADSKYATKDVVTSLQTKVETLEKTIETYKTIFDKLTQAGITDLSEEFAKIKKTTGYDSYDNEKDLPTRVTKLEATAKTVGDKDNPTEGTVWYELQSVVDAGAYTE